MTNPSKDFQRLLPRIIRFRDAPFYLGMDRNRFNAEVRPSLTCIPIGKQGIGFDRLELDAFVEHYKSCNGCPGSEGVKQWDTNERLASSRGPASGTSTKPLAGDAFARALKQLS